MSFESFYGGRMGASFVIVKRFDTIDASLPGAPQNKARYYAKNSDRTYYLYETVNGVNQLIERNGANYKNHIWVLTPCDGGTVNALPADGSSTTPITITLSDESAEGMVQWFRRGGETTDKVNYGEYVIIDTVSKNDPDNGKVYRRGMNYQSEKSGFNEAGGAEYIGQIVGPQGDTPELELKHYQEIIDAGGDYKTITYDEANEDIVPGRWFSYTAVTVVGDEDPAALGWYEYDSTNLKYFLSTDTVVDISKTYYQIDTTNYEDDIKWAFSTMKDEYGNIIGCVLGFKLPTLVVDFEANSVSPYYNGVRDPITGEWTNTNLITEDESEWKGNKWQHPFFQKWQVKIPKGIHGQDIDNLQIIHTMTMPAGFGKNGYLGTEVYIKDGDNFVLTSILLSNSYPVKVDEYDTPFNAETYEEEYNKYEYYVKLDDAYYIPGEEYYVRKDQCYMDVVRYREINYDTNPALLTYYNLGDYNIIKRVSLAGNGVLTVYYSAIPTPQNLEETLRWLDTSTLDSITIDDNGSVHVYYNTTHAPVGTDVDPYERIDSSGQAHDHVDYSKVLDWITETTLSAEGDFKVIYNNDTVKIGTDPITGRPIYGDTYETTVQWINHIEIDDDGTLKLYYCNNKTWQPTSPDPDTPDFSFDGYLKVLKDVDIQTVDPSIVGSLEGTGDQKVHVTYNTVHETSPGSGIYENDTEVIGEPLNYIIEHTMYKESPINNALGNNQTKINNKQLASGHLLVYYSDPELRKKLGTSDPTTTPVVYDKWISYPCTKLGVNIDEWIDLGPAMGEPGGIHIIKFISSTDELRVGGVPTGAWIPPEEIMDSTGYYAVGTEGRGWNVILQNGVIRNLYCFDYNTREWVNYGSLDSAEPREVIVKSAPNASQMPNPADVSLLKENGFWLAEESGIYAN